ncbi:Up-regulated during septation-domain-containing protein [Blakeslea trispora]|nr:Up-regulated during septation-domain-containing protein [Blakeslea trispora]
MDDRPNGLKLARNNFHQFSTPKREPDYNQHYQYNNINNNNNRTSTSSFSSQASLSPTLPTRSPFRIRDSLQQQQQQSKLSHVNLVILGSKSNTSLIEEPSSIYTSVSSSSSSSANTADDDLTYELQNIWKLKPIDTAIKQETVQIDSEDMLMQLLVSHAIIDSKEYPILSFDEYEQLKQYQSKLQNQINHASARLQLDKKIGATKHSLSNLSTNKNRESVMILLDEAVEADRKVKQLSEQLDHLKLDEVETEYRILQHTAGILSQGLQKLEKQSSINSPMLSSPSLSSPSSSSSSSFPDHLSRTTSVKSKQRLQQLQSEIETITHALKSILKRYNLEPNTNSATQLVSMLENQLQQQPSSSFSSSIADHRVQQLENQLSAAHDSEERIQQELKQEQAQVTQLKSMVSSMELQANKLHSQSQALQQREHALRNEMVQYRDQVFQLRDEKERLESTLNKASASRDTQQMEQQIEEQTQEYQAKLREQAAFLEKTTRQCNQLRSQHEKLSSTCHDLEQLVQDKERALDARDAQIRQLEAELAQQQQRQQAPILHNAANQESLMQLQAMFSEKEAAWIEQSEAMEANFEGIMREFDRLTGSAIEFETDKKNYERRIAKLTREIKDLESILSDERTKNLGHSQDTATTASLRKEFYNMIQTMKQDHERTLQREAEEKKRLEKQLKDLKHERDMSRYERMNKGVQTLFMA